MAFGSDPIAGIISLDTVTHAILCRVESDRKMITEILYEGNPHNVVEIMEEEALSSLEEAKSSTTFTVSLFYAFPRPKSTKSRNPGNLKMKAQGPHVLCRTTENCK
jgi:hypothetical protein